MLLARKDRWTIIDRLGEEIKHAKKIISRLRKQQSIYHKGQRKEKSGSDWPSKFDVALSE